MTPRGQVHYEAKVAGQYTVSLTCAATGVPLPGGPLRCVVLPGDLHPATSIATLSTTGGGELRAGDTIAVTVEGRDVFGNVVDGPLPTSVAVVARGAADVTLTRQAATQQPDDARASAVVFSGALAVAGAYTLEATIGGRAVNGWPCRVHVAAAAAAAARCKLSGSALTSSAPLECGRAAMVVLEAYDSLRNACSGGGADVRMLLQAADGEQQQQEMGVTDHADGSYSALVQLHTAGRWLLHVQVNHAPVKASGFELVSVHGALVAADCVVLDVAELANGVVVCGGATAVRVAPRHPSSGRRLTSEDSLGLTVTTPTGARARLPMQLCEDGRHAQWMVPWSEAGTYQVAVVVAGEHVCGSPFSITAQAQQLSLAHSVMSGEGLSACVAGQRVVVTIAARDAHGNDASAAAADAVRVEASGCTAAVKEASVTALGGGRYQLAYSVTLAGGYEVMLRAADTGERWALRGECVAAAADAARCVVTGGGQTVTAGCVAVLTVAPFDAFGNACGNDGGGLAVRAVCDGPGEIVVGCCLRADGVTEVSFD
jgi:hypothetical protein